MEFKQIVRMALDEYTGDIRKALDGLTAEERRFQPGPESHHIDFVIWHIARVEDYWIGGVALAASQVWQRGGWHDRLGLPEGQSGYLYDAQQVADLPRFDIDAMMAYYDSVRKVTLDYLQGVTPEELNRIPEPERHPGYTIGRVFSHLIVEESQHVGQIAYLRGMQRGMNA